MNKILILGSDFGVLDIIREAKRLGLYVIVTDYLETTPAKKIANEAWTISTADIDTLAEKCRANGVSGVFAGVSDFNISRTRDLCKVLGLPLYCDNDYSWKVATDKNEFKRLCACAGAPTATGYTLTDELSRDQLDKICYPVIIKPVDQSGNIGFCYCDNEEELIKAYRNTKAVTNGSAILCERRLFGPEFGVYYLLAEGEARLFCFTREYHQPGELANLYSIEDTSSHYLKHYINEINDKVIRVFHDAGFSEGIAWIETILDKDGHFYLLECGYRLGSDMENEHFKKISGFNSLKWMLDTVVGIKHSKNDLPVSLDKAYKACSATYHLFATKDSVIESIEGLDFLESIPDVNVDLPKREGTKVLFHRCFGIIQIFGEDHLKMIEKIKLVTDHFRILDSKGENLYIQFTDYQTLCDDFEAGLSEFEKSEGVV